MSGTGMSMKSHRHAWIALGALVLTATVALPRPATAQLFFDWGGQETVNDSGRQQVRINTDAKPGEIIVSFSDRKLFLITAPGQALSYPVAIPREQDRWEGMTSVTQKRENPSWTPTPTMIKENPRLPRWVPGGHPMNPLGNRALYLGSSFYRIHGTDAPWTIGTAVSKGCIRMYNKDALDVYERAKVGAKVLVTWKTYQFSPTADQPQPMAQGSGAGSGSGAGQSAGSNSHQAQTEPQSTPGASRTGAASRASGRDYTTTQRRRQQTEPSDLSVPPSAASLASTNDGTSAQQPSQQQARPPRPTTRTREGQPQRERREVRETREPAAAERSEPTDTAAAAVSTPATEAAPAAQPAARNVEQRQRTNPIETGSISERRSRAKAATPSIETTTAGDGAAKAAPAAAGPDVAMRALEAAERAAAAAERAAAAAERAERAATVRAAPAPVPAAAAGE